MRFPLRQIVGATLGRLETSNPSRLEDAFYALKLIVLHSVLAQLAYLIPDDSRCDSGELRLGLGVHHEDTDVGRRVVVGADGRGQLLLSHRAIQSRRSAGSED